MRKFLDLILIWKLREWYFDRLRGRWVKSYRIERENLAEGIEGVEMWRFKVMVRYRYTWYHASDDGSCEAEGFNLKPSKSFYKTWYDASIAMVNMLAGHKDREHWSTTKNKYRKHILGVRIPETNTMKQPS